MPLLHPRLLFILFFSLSSSQPAFSALPNAPIGAAEPLLRSNLRGSFSRQLSNTTIGIEQQRMFCAGCEFCRRFAEVAMDAPCSLGSNGTWFTPQCESNCYICYGAPAAGSRITVQVAANLTSNTPLVNSTDDPIFLLTTSINTLNLSATVFFTSYHTTPQDASPQSSSSFTEGGAKYTLAFLIQWGSTPSTYKADQHAVAALLQSPAFLYQVQQKYPGVTSVAVEPMTELTTSTTTPPEMAFTPPLVQTTIKSEPAPFPLLHVPVAKEGDDEVPSKNFATSEELGSRGSFTDTCVGCERPSLRCELLNTYPYSAVGRFDYIGPDGKQRWCTATLIDTSIILTAAHCLYNPGLPDVNGTQGWLQSAVFNMAYDGTRIPGNQALRGSYKAIKWMVMEAWKDNPLRIDEGDDIGLVIVDRDPKGYFPGERTIPMRFCYDNCFYDNVEVDLLCYPDNYSNGLIMTRSSCTAFKVADALDYRFGTGVREGSSGAPAIMNLGLTEKPTRLEEYPGLAPTRNVVLGVMSGGVAQVLKGLASPLSLYAGDTRFRQLYDTTCAVARAHFNLEAACFGISKYGIKLPYDRI